VPAWWLLCPYDTSALGGPVLEEASRSHPFVSQRGVATARPTTATWRRRRSRSRPPDLVLAVDEVAANSLRHGGGRGLWMVNQLCDLVQLRTLPAGAVVRLHLYVG
jgi:hypothetical protein